MSFVKVPVIFVGQQAFPAGTTFSTGRSAFAFTPNLANLHVITNAGTGKDELYFARQFGPRDSATGKDIFEETTRSRLADVLFVDTWDEYHRKFGDAHCGAVIKREFFSLDWWDNQP